MAATQIQSSGLKSPIDIAEYIFTRLKQVGVQSIHGLPGDYNLVALDYINPLGLKWVGNTNELNAGMFHPISIAYGILTSLQDTLLMV